MANTYIHYGVEVIRQVVEGSFKSVLKNAGQEYIELAVTPELNIIKYTKDGRIKYALICPRIYPDEYAEVVYLTPQIPDDCNWMLLVDDIERQHQGAAPVQRKTRAKMLLDAAVKNAYEALDSAEGENIFLEGADEAELIPLIKINLASYGVTVDEIKDMEHYDVSEDILNKL